jgi:hypothetical protein
MSGLHPRDTVLTLGNTGVQANDFVDKSVLFGLVVTEYNGRR